MKILAIETSCDETAIALLDISGPKEKPEIKVLANSLLSQIHLHQEYGGVYPNLAKREHQKNLPILLSQTLKSAGESEDNPNIDCIAVTHGPGLEPALWTGITFAEKLAEMWNKPIVPVNHMEGHIFSVLYESPTSIKLPAIALLVSGGHTELVKVNDFADYEIIGRTKDDAVGEAFDKVARMLGLPYPGGPEISRLAQEAREEGIEPGFEFPRPMINTNDFNFSFSGLKTAVLYKVRDMDIKNKDIQKAVARAFEDACIDVLITKTKKALELHGVETLIVAGGVSANNKLRSHLESLSLESGAKLWLPTRLLSTDNAVMIGITAYINASGNLDKFATGKPGELKAQGNLTLGD